MDAFIVKEKKMHRIKWVTPTRNLEGSLGIHYIVMYTQIEQTLLEKVGTDPRTPYAGNSSKANQYSFELEAVTI